VKLTGEAKRQGGATGTGGAGMAAGLGRGIQDCAENGSAANFPRAERLGIPGCFASDAGAEECSLYYKNIWPIGAG
jgi:hypothetical protein